MTLYVPKTVVYNWYRYDVSFSFSLMKSFIEGIEKQASESVKQYEKEKEALVSSERSKEDHFEEVQLYQGLDDASWDLNGIFKVYFPSLQRRSALQTLCGYFEHELDKLCLLYQKEKSFTLSLPDLNGKGIDRAISYLEKVAGIEVHKASAEWNHIKNIQKIRNVAVHQDGKLKDHQGNPIKAVIGYIKQIDSLSCDDDEIIINSGFLTHVLDIYSLYFKMLNNSIIEQAHA